MQTEAEVNILDYWHIVCIPKDPVYCRWYALHWLSESLAACLEYQPYWLGLRRVAFASVVWQVILCDPIWQATPRGSVVGFPINSFSCLFNFFGLQPILCAELMEYYAAPFNEACRLVANEAFLLSR